ncbi:MAG: biotin--[acetyl-CoA-carboxylase] ligase, partial [Pseudomonadota bacterium]
MTGPGAPGASRSPRAPAPAATSAPAPSSNDAPAPAATSAPAPSSNDAPAPSSTGAPAPSSTDAAKLTAEPPTVIHLAEVGSTNDEARERLRTTGTPHWVRAEVQTEGRGRRGRTWASPRGNLYTSFAAPLPRGLSEDAFAMLPLTAAVALAAAIRATSPIRPQLKWPNDVLVEGAKIAGILLEAETEAETEAAKPPQAPRLGASQRAPVPAAQSAATPAAPQRAADVAETQRAPTPAAPAPAPAPHPAMSEVSPHRGEDHAAQTARGPQSTQAAGPLRRVVIGFGVNVGFAPPVDGATHLGAHDPSLTIERLFGALQSALPQHLAILFG